MKRVIVVHGWGGYPDEGWFPWLKKELSTRGFEVIIPAMPENDAPNIDAWVSALAHVVGAPDEQTFFIGHSIGCQTILRYLASLPNNITVGGVVFVAGWFSLQGLETEEEQRIAGPWLETPIDFTRVRAHLLKSTVILSDNDPYVPLSDQEKFRKELGSKVIIEHAQGHFSGEEGCTEIPSLLKELI